MATPLVLFKLDAASSGGTPTSIADSATGTAVNLTWSPGSGSWTSNAAGNGLAFNGSAGAVSAALASSKVATALTGATACTLEVRCNLATTSGFEAIWGLGDTFNGTPLVFLTNDNGTVEIYACNALVVTSAVSATGLCTIHLVIDTTQATAANRVQLYLNGVLQTLTGATFPAQNTAIDAGSTWSNVLLELGCFQAAGSNSIAGGSVFEAAIYASALNSTTVAANHTALASNNDADPNGPSPPTITSQPSTQYVAAGGTPTFTVSATGTGTLSYQWKDRSGSNVGTNSSSYSPGAAALSDSGKSFTCDVTDSIGTTTSAVAYLVVTLDAMPFLFADFTQTGTSFADTGLSFPVAANADYVFKFALRVWCDAATTGARFQLTGPASPTAVAAGAFIPSATGSANAAVVTALSTSFFATTAGTTSATPVLVIVEGIFRNGSNAGTLSLQAAAEVTSPGAVTVAAGSYGTIAVATGSSFCLLTAARTTTGITFANVTDLSFSLAASTKYRFRFIVFFTGNATTTGARFGVTAPASPTSIRLGSQQNSGTAAQDSGSISATATVIVAATSGPGSTTNWALIEGVIQNGSNSGTLQLQSAAEIASPGTVICAVNSYGTLEVVT